MTSGDFKKVLVQIGHKVGKKKKFYKHNTPRERSCGKVLKKCRRCGRQGAHLSSYSLKLCRQCFREIAPKIGFKKFS